MVRVTALTSPLLLGFDDLERALDKVSKTGTDGYPPYNIEQIAANGGEPEKLRITLAVAGFSEDQIEVTVEESQLMIRGRQQEDKTREYLHRGIAARQFQRGFLLADGMQVRSAELAQGLLSVDLVRPQPERLVRKIEIVGARLKECAPGGGPSSGRRMRSTAMRAESNKMMAANRRPDGAGIRPFRRRISRLCEDDRFRGRRPPLPSGAADEAGIDAVCAARRRRIADHADRFQGCGDRQRLGK